jgi:hypothetical protein
MTDTPASTDEISNDHFTSGSSSSIVHQSVDQILKSSSALFSDKCLIVPPTLYYLLTSLHHRVGHLGILDLCSKTVCTMLKEQLTEKEYDDIIEASSLEPFQFTTYAQELIDALINSKLSTGSFRDILRQVGYRSAYDPIIHHDAGFVEATTRHL